MPMYDYRCRYCDTVFEELVTSSSVPDEEIVCPGCGQKRAQRLLSAPLIAVNKGSSARSYGEVGCHPSSGFS